MFTLMFGSMAVGAILLAIAIMVIPLWLGPLVQLLIAIFSRGKAARWIPGACGGVGLLLSLYYLCLRECVFPVYGVLVYWAVYGLLLWAAYGLVRLVRGRRKGY